MSISEFRCWHSYLLEKRASSTDVLKANAYQWSSKSSGEVQRGGEVIATEKGFSLFPTNALDCLGWYTSSCTSWHAPCKKPGKPPLRQLFLCGGKRVDIRLSGLGSPPHRRLNMQSFMKLVLTQRHVNFQKVYMWVKCEWVTVTLFLIQNWSARLNILVSK